MQSTSSARRAVSLATVLTLLAVAAPLDAQCVDLALPGANGCGTSTPFGIPRIACVGAPTIGNAAFAVDAIVPCTASAAALLVGGCLPQAIPIRGPFGNGGFCGPTQAPCLLFVDPAFVWPLTGVAQTGGFRFALPIPNDAGLRGLRICAQEAGVCMPPIGPCIHASQGISITL
jgi:hypothetical protein